MRTFSLEVARIIKKYNKVYSESRARLLLWESEYSSRGRMSVVSLRPSR